VDVVLDPRAAFNSVAARPAWFGTFLIIVALRFGSAFVFYHPDVTAIKILAGVVFQVVTIGPMLMAAAGLLWVATRVWGARLDWPTAVSIAAHVCLAHTIASIGMASIAGALLPASVDVDPRDPPFTSLRGLAHGSESLAMRLLGEIDLRSAYATALLAIAIRATVPQASRGRVAGVIVTCVAIRLVAVAWSAIS
jgi:hypothetical protein